MFSNSIYLSLLKVYKLMNKYIIPFSFLNNKISTCGTECASITGKSFWSKMAGGFRRAEKKFLCSILFSFQLDKEKIHPQEVFLSKTTTVK